MGEVLNIAWVVTVYLLVSLANDSAGDFHSSIPRRLKEEKRKLDLAKRQTWGELNPVTRKSENSKAYNRNKARNWKREYHEPIPGLLSASITSLRYIPRKP